MKMKVNLGRTLLVLSSFLILSMSAFAMWAPNQSTINIQAEIPSSDAIFCSASGNGGSQTLDYNFTNYGVGSMTLGVTCNYFANDSGGTSITLTNNSNLTSQGQNGPQFLNLQDVFTWTDGNSNQQPLPSLGQSVTVSPYLNYGENNVVSYQITMNNIYSNVPSGNYSGGQITFTIGPTQLR